MKDNIQPEGWYENKEREILANQFHITEHDPSETMEAGSRDNDGKLQWALVDFPALEPMVQVLEFGAQKYAPHNWKKGLYTTQIVESLIRHMIAYLNGEDKDPESNLPHTGHIMCNAMFLSYMHEFKPEFDDRENKKS